MEKRYAVSTVVFKSVDDVKGIIEGIASTPSVDRVGDIVEPKGAEFKLPIPLLFMHQHTKPIGEVLSAKVTDAGISIRAQIAKDVPVAFIQEAWELIKGGLIKGLSIGFKPKETADIEGSWGQRFTKWEWLELSAVTVPANQDASITALKSIDDAARAASGAVSKPGVSGPVFLKSIKSTSLPKGEQTMNVKEQLERMKAQRDASKARMDAIMQKSIDEGRTLDEAEKEEYDNLESELRGIDDHVKRLERHAEIVASQATVIDAVSGTNPEHGARQQQSAGKSGGGSVLFAKSNLPKGTHFTRLAMAIAASKGSNADALLYVKQFKDTPEVELALKAAIAAGNTSDANWAAPLVNYTDMASEFIDLLRPLTIVGRMTNLRRVPFNIRMAKTASGTSVGWVGQGKPKPVSAMDFDTVSLTWAKIAGIVVLTEELVRFSSPSAEAIVRDDMLKAISSFMDAQFIDPTVAAVAGTNPASVTNGVSPVTSTGATLAAITADVNTVMNNFATANLDPRSAAWVMRPRTAQYLATLRTSQDILAFPGINMMGGTFQGLPVIVSNSVPFDTGSSTYIVLADASEILFSDDGAVRLDSSNQASLQMDSAPSEGAATMVSLWQHNMIGLRAERFVNWQRRRDAAVQVIQDVSY
jgi:HK97 family phage major capsid protein/HK97 family phage prohead protease